MFCEIDSDVQQDVDDRKLMGPYYRHVRFYAGLGASLSLIGCAPVQQLRNVASSGEALVNSISATGEQTQLGAAELRQLQSRNFSATKGATFASVMTVLLDSGYRVLSADLESGLITAAASTTARLRLDTGGLAKANYTPVASAFIEELGPQSVRVRLSLSVDRSATGQLANTGEKAVLDAGTYQTFFDRLEQEISQRPIAVDRAVIAPPESGSKILTVDAALPNAVALIAPAEAETSEQVSAPEQVRPADEVILSDAVRSPEPE